MPKRSANWSKRLALVVATLLLAFTSANSEAIQVATDAPAPISVDSAPSALPASSPEGTERLVYVGSADLFLKTITDPTVSHIVVIAHLDLSGLPPVDTTSLAIARLLPTLKSLKGECGAVATTTLALVPEAVPVSQGACFLRVLHAWLEVPAAAEGRAPGVWISGFVVRRARPADDDLEAPLLRLGGGNAWLSGMVFIGDGFQGRGVLVGAGDVFIGDSHFTALRSQEGAAVAAEGADTTLSLQRCAFVGNAAAATFGGAVVTDEAELLIADCTFQNNGENDVAARDGRVWHSGGADPITVYDVNSRQPTESVAFNGGYSAGPHGAYEYNGGAYDYYDGFYDYYRDGADYIYGYGTGPLPAADAAYARPVEAPAPVTDLVPVYVPSLYLPPSAVAPVAAGDFSDASYAVGGLPEFATDEDTTLSGIQLEQQAAASAADYELLDTAEAGNAAGSPLPPSAPDAAAAPPQPLWQACRTILTTAGVAACVHLCMHVGAALPRRQILHPAQ